MVKFSVCDADFTLSNLRDFKRIAEEHYDSPGGFYYRSFSMVYKMYINTFVSFPVINGVDVSFAEQQEKYYRINSIILN